MTTIQRFIKKIESIHTLYIATFLFVITFITYANTLPNGLFFDDEDFIYKNVYVQNFSVSKYFTQNLIAGASKISNYYRPLLLITYGVEYKLFGDAGFIYHFDNLLLHAAAGILLFFLLKKLTKNIFISFLTSTLFLIHPVQTEAVSYASGRSDPLAFVFILLTMLFYLKGTTKSYVLSLIFFICAFLSRETAIITPALLLLIEFFQTRSIAKTLSRIRLLLPIISIAIFYFILRLTVLNFQNTLNFYQGQTAYSTHLYYRLLTFLSLLPTYMGFLFFPKTLNLEREATVITTFANPLVIISLFTVIVFFIFSLKLQKKHPLFLFSFLWFFVTIAPTSGIIPINGILYEHFLYLPSIAIFLIVSYCLFLVGMHIKSPAIQNVVAGVVIVSVMLLMFRTIQRNFDWHDPITFYSQIIKLNPRSARVHNNLAMALSEDGRNTEAVKEYRKAIKLSDVYPQTHFNLANSYISLNRIDDAEKEYQNTLRIDPSFVQAYMRLAMLYKQTHQTKKFDTLLKKAGSLSQKNPNFIQLEQYLKSM